MGARGHDVGQIVGGDLPHTALADHRADHAVELIGDGLTRRSLLPAVSRANHAAAYCHTNGSAAIFFLRRPARAKLRDGEIALGDRASVYVVVLPSGPFMRFR